MMLENLVRLGGAALLAGALLVVSDLLRLYITNVADADTVQDIFFVDGWVGVLLAVVHAEAQFEAYPNFQTVSLGSSVNRGNLPLRGFAMILTPRTPGA